MQAESNGDEYYTRSPNVIRQSRKLSASAKLVYQSLLYFAGDKLECFPKEETIAQDTGLTAKTVRGAIGELVAHKLISQERMEHLRGKPKGYRLHVIPAEFTGAEAVRLPAMLVNTRQERQEERPAQAPDQQRPARKPNQLSHPAMKVFNEVTGHFPSPNVEGLREAIIETVTDLDRWRRVLERNKAKVWLIQSMDILRLYREGEPQEATTSGGVFVNDDWERQLRKRGLLREEGVSSGTAPLGAARIPVNSEIPTGGNGGAFSQGQMSVVNP